MRGRSFVVFSGLMCFACPGTDVVLEDCDFLRVATWEADGIDPERLPAAQSLGMVGGMPESVKNISPVFDRVEETELDLR